MTDTPLSPLNIPDILGRYGISPRKSLGQNFLQDEAILQEIISIADIQPTESALEIGPGFGSLTRQLARHARRVVAVELDGNLFAPLRSILKAYQNIQLVHGDILKISPAEILDTPDYVVVANIPYYITSALIRHLLETRHKPSRIILTVQKEVAQRICASQGKLSLLALGVQVYGKPELVMTIPAAAFYPEPNVDSAIIRIEIFPQPVIAGEHLDRFFELARAGFSQKRKTLRNSLSGGLHLAPPVIDRMLTGAGIDPQRRAETLSLEEWGALVRVSQ